MSVDELDLPDATYADATPKLYMTRALARLLAPAVASLMGPTGPRGPDAPPLYDVSDRSLWGCDGTTAVALTDGDTVWTAMRMLATIRLTRSPLASVTRWSYFADYWCFAEPLHAIAGLAHLVGFGQDPPWGWTRAFIGGTPYRMLDGEPYVDDDDGAWRRVVEDRRNARPTS